MARPPEASTGAIPVVDSHWDERDGATKSASEDVVLQASDLFQLARQQNFQTARNLLEGSPSNMHLWRCSDEEGHSLLHWAALVGAIDFAKLCLERDVPVDAVAENQQTPLMWAVLRGHITTARLLLDNKANLRAQDSLGATPLVIAVQHKQYAAILLLLHREKHALLTDRDTNGCSVVHWAAYKGDLTALKLLEYFNADLHERDDADNLPIHRAVMNSQAHAVEFLLEQKSDPMQQNGDGKTCLDLVAEGHKDPRVVAVLKNPKFKSKGTVDPELGKSQEKSKEGLMKSVMKDKAAHKLFPTFWLVCVSLAVFEYLMDLRSLGWRLAPTGSLLFEIGVPLSLAIFAWTALTDPGKIPAKTRGASAVEDVMRKLDGEAPEGHFPDLSRLCTTTWILKGYRTKYCAQTGACVDEFDHYCIWLNCAIGGRNHRQFVILAVVEWFTQLSHLYVCWALSRELVPYVTLFTWLFGMFTAYPLLAVITLVHCITVPWVFMLVLHQGRLITMNLTTNEMMNAHRYEHMWVQKAIQPGLMHREFRNPFSKGSAIKNCLDFWWFRRRSVMMAVAPPQCHAGCCKEHQRG